MTKFTDGAAAGKVLALRRSPLYLRVVRNSKGEIDALDQLDDQPGKNEEVFVYARTEFQGHVHICRSRGRGGYYAMAAYQLVACQPDQEILRDQEKWQTWAFAQSKPSTPITE